MSTASAAYCSACNRYVYVAEDGGCERGHPRSSLRAIYIAEIDRKTGRPKPPTRQSQTPIPAFTKLGAVLAQAATVPQNQPLAPPHLTPTPAKEAPVESVVLAEAAGATHLPAEFDGAPTCQPHEPVSGSALPVSVKAPRTPMMFDVAGAAIWPSDFMGLGGLSRLLNAPRGKHSAPPHAGKPPRGRHSQGATRSARDAAT